MSLTTNSLPAERQRGLVFAESFVNAAEVVENGGTITGTPVINQGATLDGTNDYITYNFVGQLNSATLSFAIDFMPDFAGDDGADHYFFDSHATGRCLLNKTASNTLALYLGNTFIGSSAFATWGSVWNVGGKNNLVVSGTTGDTSMWLNGTLILDADATAWTPADSVTFYIGAKSDASAKFDGVLESIKIFQTQLTDQEALDYSNGGGFWNYLNEAYFNLPMTLESHDPTNTRTLDVVGGGINATWSAGATAPTKNTTKRGYNFDGGDLMTMSTIPVGTNDFTTVALIRDSEGTGVGSDGILGDANGGAAGHIIPLYFNSGVGNFTVNIDGSSKAGGSVVSDGTRHVIGISADRSDKAHYFVDGIEVGTGQDISAKVASDVNVSNPQIGRVGAGTYLVGDVSDMIFWNDRALTPMQHADIAGRLLRQINQL